MPRRTRLLPILALLLVPALAAGQELSVHTGRFRASIADGELGSLVDPAGAVMVRAGGRRGGITIHHLGGDAAGKAVSAGARIGAGQQAVCQYTQFAGLAQAEAQTTFAVEAVTGDLTIAACSTAKTQGVWGLGWSIGQIPDDYAIIVPGRSGIRLTRQSPGDRHTFDYPMGWEAQLVIVEGPGRGFYVWADDAAGRYKRLIVRRGPAGWELQLVTLNDAPFERLTECRSALWRLNTYEGDWRVPARRYRDWMIRNWQPTPLERQRPEWIRGIRACVIMGLARDVLEQLPSRFTPAETLLYLPTWRAAGYDRNYPDYDALLPEFEPFLRRARELGFRVMVHTNYFGVDPLHPLYARFEPHQVRSPWDQHEKQWWLWERSRPVIRFAYINPALKAWREHLVAAMVRLCRRLPIDALHLDQTLCIYNDQNGRVEGLSMLEGNLALHRELRAALPEVALSGEGLNEATCRYEAFAQRHAWGLNHADGTWFAPALRCAHPISSYLFLPYTKIYGYLGYAPPESDQLYAAWNEAYEHWGVIPTLKPRGEELRKPSPFARQLFDEVAFYQSRRVEPDLEAPWPAGVAFPLRTADGQPAIRACDGRFTCQGRTISWTVRGVNQVDSSGSIPGWQVYNARRLMGLNPERWYAHFEAPRDLSAFHVAELPEGAIAEEVFHAPELAVIRTRPAVEVVADLVREIARATCGTMPGGEEEKGTVPICAKHPSGRSGKWGLSPFLEVAGPLQGDDGAQFVAGPEMLLAHPAWKHGTAPAFARYKIQLPRAGRLRFVSEIALAKGAMAAGRSDGVTFQVSATAGQEPLRRAVHHASEDRQPFSLDLTPLAGQTITLTLVVDPGPKHDPSSDWARWHRPRIEQEARCEGRIAIAGPQTWKSATGAAGRLKITHEDGLTVIAAPSLGAICLLRDYPLPVEIPAELAGRTRIVATISDAGLVLDRPPVAGVSRAMATIGGVKQSGLRAHPPDHGRTIAHFPLLLPAKPAVFRAAIGVAGDKSTGVVFQVELNGRVLVRRAMLPGRWQEVEADLSAWSGQPAVLTLTTDSDGPFSFDWAHWGRPRLEPK